MATKIKVTKSGQAILNTLTQFKIPQDRIAARGGYHPGAIRRLVNDGLAKRLKNGSVSITPKGRKFLA